MGMNGGGHDGDVIAASLHDPDCFTEIFERHFDAIYAFTARRLGRELTDDLGATVFVVPVRPAADGASVVLSQPEADQALALFRGEAPSSAAPSGQAVGPSTPPAPAC